MTMYGTLLAHAKCQPSVFLGIPEVQSEYICKCNMNLLECSLRAAIVCILHAGCLHPQSNHGIIKALFTPRTCVQIHFCRLLAG